MGLLDILKQYTDGATPTGDPQAHFDEVAREAPPEDLGRGISSAFRSDATPPFSQMVGSLFGQSNPQQRAGMLNELISAVGPSVLAGAGGGVLGRLLGGAGTATPTVTPDQASQVSPADVSAIAAHAQNHDASVVDRLGSFYAQHPALVQTLGAAALGVVMRNMRR